MIKRGFVVPKGMGSAFGGEWKPKKPEDERFLGEPGEIKTTVKKNGTIFLTKIGEDGRAVKERHYTSHYDNDIHSNPHDHIINWESPFKGKPNFQKPQINYWGEIPEFKQRKGRIDMNHISTSQLYDTPFETINEFKECVIRGAEITFLWNGKEYAVDGCDSRGFVFTEACENIGGKYYNRESRTEYNPDDELIFDTVDELLETVINGDKLRDIITQVVVTERTL